MGRKLKPHILCGGAMIALVQAATASAQTAPAGQAVDEVVVTGSRVITNGFAAPTPLTVVTQEQMKLTAPNSLSDAINQLPQFKSSFVSASSGFRNGAGDGGNFINLRGLGAKRGLVLLNGERVVQSQASTSVAGAVDLNVLPQSLVKRVDVVTGGATAAYGSDALTGVVNFVLDTKFTGLKGEIRGGLTTYNDNHNGDISLAYGRGFAGDRGHIVASVEHFRTDGVADFTDRPWDNNATASISTGTGLPTVVSAGIRRATQTSGGIVTAGATALRDQTFLTSAGTLTPFPYGRYHTTTGATMVGGGFDPDFGRTFSLMPSNTRDNAYFRVGYDLTPDWTLHADVLYGSSTVHYRGLYQSGSYTIFADNAFLTPAQKTLANGAGATSTRLYNPATGQFNGATTNTFTVGRINTDWGFEEEHSYFTMVRESAGIDGKIGRWNVSAYYTHGESAHKDTSPGEANNVRLYDALDAVASPGTAGLAAAGTPICRSTIANPTNGCVPLNILGQNVASPQALAYIQAGGGPMLSQHLTQDVVDFSFRGEPFSLWAGPVSLGAGATYRKEQGRAVADNASEAYNPAILTPLSPLYKPGLTAPLTINGYPTALQGARGDWSGFNPGGSTGAFDVKEVFAETLVPLAKDQFLAKALNFNGAIRYADYSTAGGQTNWKVGLIYQPVDDIKFRGTMSQDIRAPNLFDLFGGVTQSNGQFLDAATNAQTQGAVTVSQGNRALKPEVGNTTVLGVVLQPRMIPGFSMSVDHYLIIISNAIASPGGQTITSQCKLGNASFCSLFVRDPVTGLLTTLFNNQQNIGTTKQSGLDIETSYRLPLSRFFANRDDVVSFRVLANYMDKNSTFILGSTSITNAVGINGGGIVGGTGGNVDWQGSLNVNYAKGPLTLNWQERFINGGKIVATADAAGIHYPSTAGINPSATNTDQLPNTIPAFFYTDVSATYKFGKDRRYEAFVTVANLFNKAPPTDLGSAAFGVGVLPTNYTLYDTLGRNYTMGVRFKF